MNGEPSEPIERMVARYRTSAMEWDALQGIEAMKRTGNANRANLVLRSNHELAKLLRRTEAGRDEIMKLMADPGVGVRLLAATETLGWAPVEASAVLEEIQGSEEAGLRAISAKYTLSEFRAGRLNLDW